MTPTTVPGPRKSLLLGLLTGLVGNRAITRGFGLVPEFLAPAKKVAGPLWVQPWVNGVELVGVGDQLGHEVGRDVLLVSRFGRQHWRLRESVAIRFKSSQ
jgi:hypothetical protein